jgi:hypothetical protein
MIMPGLSEYLLPLIKAETINIPYMKKMKLSVLLSGIILFMVLFSCTTVNLTSWKDPSISTQVNKVFVLALFERLEFTTSFENNATSYLTSKGMQSLKSLDYFAPNQQFTVDELKAKLNSLGVDALLVFAPKGVDKSVNYTPPTYSGFYGGYRGGYYNVSPGYYSESSTYHIQANLYSVADEKLMWTGDLNTTDPGSVEAAVYEISKEIYQDWVKNQIIKPASSGK